MRNSIEKGTDMSRYNRRHYRQWAPYVPVAERRRRARAKIKKLQKKGRVISPVEIAGRKIARTFWGEAWCDNLEAYSDFANRLPRGRTYVRNGSVMDLQIEPGKVTSLVSGSSLYDIKIKITPQPARRWKKLVKECAGQIDSLVELLQGRFSEGVMEILCRKQSGLFPAPKEIDFSCSCPDWAVMCKHVAATLYGVGARLDQQPELLFRLRRVDETDLIASAGEAPIAVAESAAGFQTLQTDDLSSMFGIDLDQAPPAPSAAPQGRQRTGRAAGKAIRRGRKSKAAARKHGARISARELTARGIPHSRIQSWLRSGVLKRSSERGIYLTTAATGAKIDEYLATKKAGASKRSSTASSARGKKRARAKARPTRSARGKKPARAKTKISARELTALGVPHSAIQSWLRSGVLLRTGQRGVYRKTRDTAKNIAEYLEKR